MKSEEGEAEKLCWEEWIHSVLQDVTSSREGEGIGAIPEEGWGSGKSREGQIGCRMHGRFVLGYTVFIRTERHSTKAETRSRISHLLNPDSFEDRKKSFVVTEEAPNPYIRASKRERSERNSACVVTCDHSIQDFQRGNLLADQHHTQTKPITSPCPSFRNESRASRMCT